MLQSRMLLQCERPCEFRECRYAGVVQAFVCIFLYPAGGHVPPVPRGAAEGLAAQAEHPRRAGGVLCAATPLEGLKPADDICGRGSQQTACRQIAGRARQTFSGWL